MRNVMKAATLESKFPILAVEHDCIISKDADITVAYQEELPDKPSALRRELAVKALTREEKLVLIQRGSA